MTGAEYWLGREKEWIAARNRKTDRLSRELEKAFLLAAEDLQKEIAGWMAKYTEAEGITMADARRRLSTGELQRLKMNLEQFTRLAKENADGRWEKELTAASAAVHVTRLEALELQMKNLIRRLYAGQEADMTDFLTDLYGEERQRMTYEVQRAQGAFNPLAVLPEDRVQKILQRPWADDGKAFSSRLWGTQNQLINVIQSELVRGIISGRDTGAIGTAVAQRMGAARYAGVRLIQTEATRLIVEADKDTFAEMGVEQVEIVGTLDRNTCDSCGSLDGQVMKRTEARAGSTAPPFHPNCRCIIVPYDEALSGDGQRTARDPESGKSVDVGDMTYKDWKAVYVDKNLSLSEWQDAHETSKNDTIKKKDILEELRKRNVAVSLDSLPDNISIPNMVEALSIIDGNPKLRRYLEDYALSIGGVTLEGAYGLTRYCLVPQDIKVELNKNLFKDIKEVKKNVKRQEEDKFKMPASEEEAVHYTLSHEMGHVLECVAVYERLGNKTYKSRRGYTSAWTRITNAIENEILDCAKEINPDFSYEDKLNAISMYGVSNAKEFFAECHANMRCGKPNILGKAMKLWLERWNDA